MFNTCLTKKNLRAKREQKKSELNSRVLDCRQPCHLVSLKIWLTKLFMKKTILDKERVHKTRAVILYFPGSLGQ